MLKVKTIKLNQENEECIYDIRERKEFSKPTKHHKNRYKAIMVKQQHKTTQKEYSNKPRIPQNVP